MAVIPDQTFGVLKRLDPRSIWKNEASDFTPWLARNLKNLGEALNMELEIVHTEAPVGAFSLDILAKDVGRDRTVIIENQLEATDHDHLGKVLTYAAGHNASAVVWVAKEMREEHRQTLDWLNQHTDTDIEFYGVVLEVLQIDDSPPAFNFRPVAFPNQWRKSRIESGPSAEISERQEAYRRFFQEVIDDLRQTHRFTGARKGQPQSWYLFTSGISGVYYGASFALGNRVRVELYLDTGDAASTKELFDRLYEQRSSIEATFGEGLEWERLNEKRASRVAIYREGSIDQGPEKLMEIKKWVIDRLLRFKRVLEDSRVRGVVQSIETEV